MKTKLMVLLLCLACAMPLAAASMDDEPTSIRVDLNRAGVVELMELPGIGEKVAERIVEYRKENGPFRETRELMNVRGIGEKTFLKLEKLLTLSQDDSARK